jgi:hypothetical protein
MFKKYPHWFSGNDNHIGDIGEYWTLRFFDSEQPILSPNKNDSWDIELKDGSRLSVKTMSEWNTSGRGSLVKGIQAGNWQYLVAVRLDGKLHVNKFCVVPHSVVKERVPDRSQFKWWNWLGDFERDYPAI